MSDSTTACGCCTGLAALAPETNAPGLPALNYRLAAYADFFARMRAQIASPTLLVSPPATGDWAISSLSTRSSDDPAIALLDAWAVVLDVLTFYQERIANEGFLRTALERRSVLELARAIGYELSPGVAASTYLSFIIEDVIGAPSIAPLPQGPKTPSAPTQGASTYNAGIVTLPIGTQVQSIPPQGALPQTFETGASLLARTYWNLMLPRLTRPADYVVTSFGFLALIDSRAGFGDLDPASIWSLSGQQCYLLNGATPALTASQMVNAVIVDHIFLSGGTTTIKPGDLLLMVGLNAQQASFGIAVPVVTVTAMPALGQTRINFTALSADLPFSTRAFPSASVPGTAQPFNKSSIESWILSQSISESDLQALIKISNWDPALLASVANSLESPSTSGLQGIYSFSSVASCFGHNAPLWAALVIPPASTPAGYLLPWDASGANGKDTTVGTNSQGKPYTDASLYLERSFPILNGSLAVVEGQGTAQPWSLQACQVITAVDKSLADYGLSGKSTGLTLSPIDTRPLLTLGQPTIFIDRNQDVLSFSCGVDGGIYLQQKTQSGKWNSFDLIAPGAFSSAPVILSMDGVDASYLFAIDANYILWWSTVVPNSSPTTLTTGRYLYTPAVVYSAPLSSITRSFIDVFVIGLDSQLYHVSQDITFTWSNYSRLGPNSPAIVGAPCAIVGGPSPLEVFYICNDGQLYHTWLFQIIGTATTNIWLGPQLVTFSSQISLVHSPSAVIGTGIAGQSTIDLFAHGADGHLYHTWYVAGFTWHVLVDRGAPALQGANFINSPCLVEGGPSPLEVFSIADDGHLYHTWWLAGQWYGPEQLGGGNLVGSPSAVAVSIHRIDVVAYGSDGIVYHFYLNAPGLWPAPELLVTGPFITRKTKVHCVSQEQTLVELPLTDDVVAGATMLMLNGLVVGLTPGQAIAITGERADAPNVIASEIVLLSDIQHIGGFTELQIDAPGLQYSYLRNTVTLNGNTVLATHGASIAVSEVLGSGDATQLNQSFTLKRTPLTYIPAATSSGANSTLTIRVNDLLWIEQPSLYTLGPSDRCYITRLADDGTVTVTFGDGVTGARLPSGQNNVIAQYRVGVGSTGNVAAGSLSILQSRPPGLRSVNNVLPASGGADAQNLGGARSNAPLTVLTLDRIVSVSDYENFAAAFAGIGKAQAILLPLQSSDMQIIHVTIAGVHGAVIPSSSDLFLSLSGAIDLARDPLPLVHISNYQPALFNVVASLVIDTPTYVTTDVLAAATAAMLAYFAFELRAFAQNVTAAEVVATLQAVPGVVAVDLNQLYRIDRLESCGRLQPVLPARSATLPVLSSQSTAASIFAQILPAELLLLNPIGLSLTEKLA